VVEHALTRKQANDRAMANELSGRQIAFLVANEGVEEVELTRPWAAVKRAGGQPVLAATKPGKTQAFNHLDKGDLFDVDVTTDRLQATDYDGIILPGGLANPDQLRMDAKAVQFVEVFRQGGRQTTAG
jgi:protease I